MLRLIIVVLLVLIYAVPSLAQVWVDPYTRRDGTQVPGHYRTRPDNNPYNNWSSQGNINPYTGERGYNNPYPNPYRQNSPTFGGYNNPNPNPYRQNSPTFDSYQSPFFQPYQFGK